VAKVAEAATPRTYASVNRTPLAIIHEDAEVDPRAAVGTPGEWRTKPTIYPAVISDGAVIREFARVHAGCIRQTLIGPRTLVMAGAHVGHDARVGEDCDIAPNAVLGGGVTLGDRVKVGMGATINPFVTIGTGVRVGAGAVVTKDIPAGETWIGNPARRQHKFVSPL
jgi:acyl-[acyl carrier protein]--UDP-N-acetylglucosamine O-acyltransferase